MLRKFLILGALGLILFPAAAQAQFDEGDWEMTLTGTGDSDNDFEDNDFNGAVSLGYFFTDGLEAGVRQGLGFNDTAAGSDWDGSTRVFLDYHFDMDRWQPFIGVQFGGIYGDDVHDTFIAGPEGGVKYFVNSTTFIFASIEYQFLFDDSDEADEAIDDGRFVYGLGIGFKW